MDLLDCEERYLERTVEHIHRVQKNMVLLITKYSSELNLKLKDRSTLMHNVMKHDQSKFSVVQYVPYIELTKYYDEKRADREYTYSEEMEGRVDFAIQDHYICENHHAEKHGGDVRDMTALEVIEVCCDLQAMAQEFNEGTCRKYWRDTWLPKYNYGTIDRDYMNKVIECFEKELNINKEVCAELDPNCGA